MILYFILMVSSFSVGYLLLLRIMDYYRERLFYIGKMKKQVNLNFLLIYSGFFALCVFLVATVFIVSRFF